MLPPPQVVYTVPKMADRLNLTLYTIRNCIKAGKLKAIMIGGRRAVDTEGSGWCRLGLEITILFSRELIGDVSFSAFGRLMGSLLSLHPYFTMRGSDIRRAREGER